MVVHVVDLFEVVDVQENDAQRFVAAVLLEFGVQFAEPRFKLSPVGRAGQRILVGCFAKLLVQDGVLFRVRQVANDLRDAVETAIGVVQRERMELDLPSLAGFARQSEDGAMRIVRLDDLVQRVGGVGKRSPDAVECADQSPRPRIARLE